MNARLHLERLFGGPAPAEAPPKTVPDAPPKERPRTEPPSTDPDLPDPWRRKDIQPGEEPMKMRYRSRIRAEAMEFLKRNDLDEFAK